VANEVKDKANSLLEKFPLTLNLVQTVNLNQGVTAGMIVFSNEARPGHHATSFESS
jgi:hypothetical protein